MDKESFDRRNGREAEVVPTTEARQGETTGRMRWVLVLSMALAVVLLAAAYFYFQH